MKNLRSFVCFIDKRRFEKKKRYDTVKPTRPLGKHLGFLKEVFNGIDFYCSPNSVKTLTGLLNRFRPVLLNARRGKGLLSS